MPISEFRAYHFGRYQRQLGGKQRTQDNAQTNSDTARLFREAGFKPVTEETAAGPEVLYQENDKGIQIEPEDDRLIVTDIRYMNDGDDGGLFVYAAANVADALRASDVWQATADLFPVPARRRAFEALMVPPEPSPVADAA